MELNGDEVREDLQGATVDAVCSLHGAPQVYDGSLWFFFWSPTDELLSLPPDNATAVDWDTHWFSLLGVPGLWKDEEPAVSRRALRAERLERLERAWQRAEEERQAHFARKAKAKQPPTKDPPASKPKASNARQRSLVPAQNQEKWPGSGPGMRMNTAVSLVRQSLSALSTQPVADPLPFAGQAFKPGTRTESMIAAGAKP